MNPRFSPLAAALAATLLALWIFFLRAPSFDASLWNVDEGIHAAVATTLHHGGTLYRDAIDQRTPLSYSAFAAVFAVAGDFNLPAVRALVATMIAATGLGVFLLGRRAAGTLAGALAALVFAAFSTNLLGPGDAFAAHTEWFAILFTTWGAWLFWRTSDNPSFLAGAGCGAVFALGFLSKQPTLLDLGAPIVGLGLFALGGTRTWHTVLRVAAGILVGWVAVVSAVAAWFAAHGALGDAVFYAWTYNVKFYGPEISAFERAAKALMPLDALWRHYPVALAGLLLAGSAALVQLVQLRPRDEELHARPWRGFLLAWCVLTFAGAASGGRGFEHYAIQCLPAFALLAGTGLRALLPAQIPSGLGLFTLPSRQQLRGAAVGLLITAVALESIVRPFAARGLRMPPPDPATPVANFIRTHSAPDETLFVWGYNPDIHVYAQRPAASRFVYSSFLTGLIPWTNLAPEKDTKYAIVPGAMDTLLRDLEKNRPTFIVDCTPGPHRHFEKYPLAKFPALERFVAEHYVVVDAPQFVPRGFRLHLIRDSFRRTPVSLAGPAATPLAPPPPDTPENADLRATDVTLSVESADASLQRLELLIDDAVVDGVSFLPSRRVLITLSVPFGKFPAGRHVLTTRATHRGGVTITSAPYTVTTGGFAVPAAEQAHFGLPFVQALLPPLTVQAPYGPAVHVTDGRRQFAVHAPSVLAFALDGSARSVSGSYGITAGAYAPENKSPTDGAGFRITLFAADGTRTVLLQRLLRPAQNDWERGEQKFVFDLPPHGAGSRIEFVTDNGPNGNGACDWTFWNDLRLEAVR